MQSDRHFGNNEKDNKERRSGVDRRASNLNFGFPFIDSHGNLVTEDRRITDRRTQQPSNSSKLKFVRQKELSRQSA